jgi:hypothetical protein
MLFFEKLLFSLSLLFTSLHSFIFLLFPGMSVSVITISSWLRVWPGILTISLRECFHGVLCYLCVR